MKRPISLVDELLRLCAMFELADEQVSCSIQNMCFAIMHIKIGPLPFPKKTIKRKLCRILHCFVISYLFVQCEHFATLQRHYILNICQSGLCPESGLSCSLRLAYKQTKICFSHARGIYKSEQAFFKPN